VIPPEFGCTPWGRAWVRTVESTTAVGPNPMLPKARSLARNHAVTLSTGTGRLYADVSASDAVQRVRIDLPRWPARTQAETERLIAKATADAPGLAVGDLPDTLEADLARHNISFAVGLDEQVAACDCRTRRRPCVHILATIYTLVQLIDERPALAIELRSSDTKLASLADLDWVELTEIDAASFYGD